jgi:hypothetical protein
MKKLALIAAAAATLFGSSAFAATVGDSFDVTINLSTACTITGGLDVSIAYTAFQAGNGTGSTSPVINCTRGLAPTAVVFNDNAGTMTSSAAGASVTGEGVINGLRYTMSTSLPTVAAGTAASAGAGGTGGSNGTADTYSMTINVVVPSGQAGSGAGGAASQTRTLTVTY